MKIRIKFAKQGSMKFIGHLDIMRYFQKAMRRADVDIRYSEGFSPHQVMSFAAPLGVGLTGKGEYLDIEVLTTKDSKTMVAQLNQVMAEGMTVLSYRRLDDSAQNAMSLVHAADYTLTFRDGCQPADTRQFFDSFQAFYKKEAIVVLKKTKKGERVIDIKPLIYDCHVDENAIYMRLSTGSTDNLKPELVLTAFYEFRGETYPEFAFQIQREEVYGPGFITLEDLGEDIE